MLVVCSYVLALGFQAKADQWFWKAMTNGTAAERRTVSQCNALRLQLVATSWWLEARARQPRGGSLDGVATVRGPSHNRERDCFPLRANAA
jgi:hypothetical protein